MYKKYLGSITTLAFAGCVLFSQTVPNHNQPEFYFGGRQFYVGMPMADALKALSSCCKLSPALDSKPEKQPSAVDSHFILSTGASQQQMLGAIYFSGGKVVRISRVLAPEVDSSDENLVSFLRALKRALPEGSNAAVVSVRHEPASNGESDVMTVVFANGRGVELRIGTLDKADTSNRRDFVTLDETLASNNR